MPFSSENGKKYIKDIVSRLPHESILDVGAGCGTYGKMFPNSHKTGVEVWPAYIDKYGLNDIYDDLHVGDARSWHPPTYYDVAFAGDVLEHMTREEAFALFTKLQFSADTVVISIPLGHYPQGEYEGNPYEAHVVDNWTDEDFRNLFGEPTYSKIEGEIGVYIYSKHKIKPKICVYAISKNEAHFAKRFCESAQDADLILIADTGSTDGLPEEAAKYGAVIHHIGVTPWRFDIARNTALSLVPMDIDICISLDIDEVLQSGWREEVERVWKIGTTTRMWYLFDWSCGVIFNSNKIHSRHGYKWHHPCHEMLRPSFEMEEVYAHTEKLLIVHMPDPNKSRGSYLDLLRLSVKEDPHCPRNAFYYARELSFYGHWQQSIDECKRYLALPDATWNRERCYAYRVIGRCHKELGNMREAEKAFHMGALEAPDTREPWSELATLCYLEHRWPECFSYAFRALQITVKENVYTADPAVWGPHLHDLAAISAWRIGLTDIAVKEGKIALELSPDDERLKTNLQFYMSSDNVDKPAIAAE